MGYMYCPYTFCMPLVFVADLGQQPGIFSDTVRVAPASSLPDVLDEVAICMDKSINIDGFSIKNDGLLYI